jgi:hypothetical protein
MQRQFENFVEFSGDKMRLISQFEETGSIVDIKSPQRAHARRSLENTAVVRQSVDVSPGKSIRRRS